MQTFNAGIHYPKYVGLPSTIDKALFGWYGKIGRVFREWGEGDRAKLDFASSY